jgi:hypothetical protein
MTTRNRETSDAVDFGSPRSRILGQEILKAVDDASEAFYREDFVANHIIREILFAMVRSTFHDPAFCAQNTGVDEGKRIGTKR